MNIFLRYEISSRELDANILMGLVAASRGHRALVCDWPMMMRGMLLRRREPGFVHMNSLTPSRSVIIFHRIFKFLGYSISSMDQEAGIQRSSYETFARDRFGEATVSAVDLIFCWGPDDFETIRRLYPEYQEKVVMPGSPRVDLWGPKFSSVYAKPGNAAKPFVLILSSLGPLLVGRIDEVLFGLGKSGYLARNPELEAQIVGQYKEGADLMLAYLELIRSLSHGNQDLDIVVKAHPSEDPEIWRKMLGKTGRVVVDTETPTSQLIREGVAVISTGSTAAFEAELSGTPYISFQPIATPHRNLGFADQLGIQAKSVPEVQTVLAKILDPRQKTWLRTIQKNSRAKIGQKLYLAETGLAAERIVDAWEKAFEAKEWRPRGRSIFSVPIEEFRYFVASAFPFLIPFFVRGQSLTRALTLTKGLKRPPLDRKLMRARVAELQAILGLQTSVRCRFRGRRGLVIEPTRSFPTAKS